MARYRVLAFRSHDDSRGRSRPGSWLGNRISESPGTVRLSLTLLGSDRLDTLAELYMEELARLAPTMEVLGALDRPRADWQRTVAAMSPADTEEDDQ